MLCFQGNRDHRKFTRNPCRCSQQNLEATPQEKLTEFLLRAGKAIPVSYSQLDCRALTASSNQELAPTLCAQHGSHCWSVLWQSCPEGEDQESFRQTKACYKGRFARQGFFSLSDCFCLEQREFTKKKQPGRMATMFVSSLCFAREHPELTKRNIPN